MKQPPRLSVPALAQVVLPDPWLAPRPRGRWQLRPALFWLTLALGALFVLHVLQLAFSGQSQPLNHAGPMVTALPASPGIQADQPTAAVSSPESVLVSAAPQVLSQQPYVRVWTPPTPSQRAAETPVAGQTAQASPNSPAPLSVSQGTQATPQPATPSPSVAATTTPAATASPTPQPSPTPSRQPRPSALSLGATINAVCEEISHESTPIDNPACRP